jgi:hypothetical protein
MCRFFMPGRIVRCAIDFHQHKPRRIILLLDEVKPGNARFLYAVAGIFNTGGPEGFYLIRLNTDKNMDYQHNILLFLTVSLFNAKFTRQAEDKQMILTASGTDYGRSTGVV